MMPVLWDADRLAALQPAVDANPWGPMESAVDVLHGASLYEYQRGQEHALLAVRPVRLAHGVRLDVVGLVSIADRLNMGALSASLESVAHQHGAAQLAMCTQRAHLVKQCSRFGWGVTGLVLTKALNVQ